MSANGAAGIPAQINSQSSLIRLTPHFTVVDILRNAELGISLHILEQNLLPAAVIELRGAAIGVTGDSLSGFKGAVIFQKIRDPVARNEWWRIMSRRKTSLILDEGRGEWSRGPLIHPSYGNKERPGYSPSMDSEIPKIVSGGQTGADRAALEWALSRGSNAAAGVQWVEKPWTGRFRANTL